MIKSILQVIFAASMTAMGATAPRLDTVSAFPPMDARVYVKLSSGGHAGAYYVYENSVEQVDVRRYSPGGELIFNQRLKAKGSQYANVMFELGDSSFVVAGNLPGQSLAACKGSWVARFRDRELLWHRQFCDDSTGVAIAIQRGCPIGNQGMLFAGQGKIQDSAQPAVFLEMDFQGRITGSATTRMDGVMFLEFDKGIRTAFPDLVFPLHTMKSQQDGRWIRSLAKFDIRYGLTFRKDLGSDQDYGISDYRSYSDGSIGCLGLKARVGTAQQDAWFFKLDAKGDVLQDTILKLPIGSDSVCVPDEDSGLALAYGNGGKLTLVKVDQSGRTVYHHQYDRFLEYGALYANPQALGPGLVFLDRNSPAPGLLVFGKSGSDCGPTSLGSPTMGRAATGAGSGWLFQGRRFDLSGRATSVLPGRAASGLLWR